MFVTLTVKPAKKDDVYFDTIRIPKTHRGSLDEGIFCLITHKGEKAYVALRGSEETTKIIQLDDKTRTTLGVEKDEKCEFRITKLRWYKHFLPVWYASNPYTRFISRIALASFALGAVSVMPMLISFGNWIAHLLCRYT